MQIDMSGYALTLHIRLRVKRLVLILSVEQGEAQFIVALPT